MGIAGLIVGYKKVKFRAIATQRHPAPGAPGWTHAADMAILRGL